MNMTFFQFPGLTSDLYSCAGMNKSAMRKEVHIEVSEGISEKSDGSLWQPLIDDESNIIDWLHLCSAHGLFITQEYFFEEILNSMQVLTHGKIR